jgi:hypothetical protein
MDTLLTGYGSLPAAALQTLAKITSREDPSIVGIIQTGPATREMAAIHSDVDVIVVHDKSESVCEVTKSLAIYEIRKALAELETL